MRQPSGISCPVCGQLLHRNISSSSASFLRFSPQKVSPQKDTDTGERSPPLARTAGLFIAPLITNRSGNRGCRRFVGAVAALLDARVLPLRDQLRTGGRRSELDDERVELPEFFLDEVEGRAEAFRERLADTLCHARSVNDGVVIRVFRFQRGDGGGGDAVSRGIRFRDDAPRHAR